MPDPFPNELVEAAAKALRTSEIPITLSPTEGWVFDADESARAVLAAVLPLIEQREARERTTREIVEALRERVLMRAAADFIEKGDTELPDSGWTRRDCILADLYATRERADRALEALTGAVGRLRAETEEDMAHWPGVTDPRSAVAALRHAADLIESRFLSPDSPEGNA